MEGATHSFNCKIDDQGVLRMNMVEFKSITEKYKNKQVIMTIEILDQGDTVLMLTRYRKHIIPKAIEGFRNLGTNYTDEQCDNQLRCLTTTCHMEWNGEMMIVPVDQLDREMMKKFMDEVTLFCAENLNIIL